MGALFDGFEAARQKQEALIAERRRREEIVDQHLQGLSKLLDEDQTFLDGKGFGHDIGHHTLRILRNQSPIIVVHYEAEASTFRMKSMSDDTEVTMASAEDAAKTLGEMVFRLVAPRG